MVSPQAHDNSVWNDFISLEQTLCADECDHKEWHRGRNEYAIWAINIENQEVQCLFDAAVAHMAEFLLEPYERQPHITVFVCGFLAESKRYYDDYSAEELEVCIETLKTACLVPFEIKIGGINSFAATPFLDVLDISGGIKAIRNVLSGNRPETRDGGYIPHVTIGLYSGHFDTKAVAKKISSFRPHPAISHSVGEISLMTYSAYEKGGPLTVRHVVRLGEK